MFIQKKIFLSVLLVLASCAESFALTIDNLRVQALLNPSGIDQSNLQFSWQLQSAERGVVQTSYHLVLTKDTAGEDVVFDSGVVQSEQSVGVEVNSLALQPAQRYYWHVTVQDNKGQTATSTEPAYFETGLMGTGWSGAKWMEASDVPAGEATNEVTDYTVEGKVRIEHTAAGGFVKISAAQNNLHTTIVIEDNGALTLEELCSIMGKSPPWAEDLLLLRGETAGAMIWGLTILLLLFQLMHIYFFLQLVLANK